MPDCTPDASLQLILTWLLPPAAGLLSTIGVWVASRARITSQVALSTSMEAMLSSDVPQTPREPNGSPSAAQARKKS